MDAAGESRCRMARLAGRCDRARSWTASVRPRRRADPHPILPLVSTPVAVVVAVGRRLLEAVTTLSLTGADAGGADATDDEIPVEHPAVPDAAAAGPGTRR